jgi:hypothetical protein
MTPAIRQKPLNKVKRGAKITVWRTVPGWSLDCAKAEKYSWICMTCGRIWQQRYEAEMCKHRDREERGYKCLGKVDLPDLFQKG